ncbi:hypothetical protein MNBD_GAMMA20-1854 [hydrothermal vent metagenome]|uniref:Cell wall hydrolase SleB domain-containing protein n=1 Tax=hydrothermal vent metagenome TaxID=652676 RepID=A0A3B1B7M6_9ZZZZ
MRIFLLLLLTFGAERALAETALSPEEAKELRCLALNIYFEARSEPINGQLAVAFVTINRVEDRRYPKTLCGVVWQKRQFSWTHDGKSDRPQEQRAWKQAQMVARFIFTKYLALPEKVRRIMDRTNGALHYYAPKLADPYWAKAKVVTFAIGGHVFLVERS